MIANFIKPWLVSAALLASILNSVSAQATQDDNNPQFPQLFTGSPDGEDGEAGCNGTYNGDWQSYTSTTTNSITLTAGDDCRTVNTSTNNSCVFNLGTGGVTQISFDFSISDECHQTLETTDWLAFWIYTKAPPKKWISTAEVDFIESLHGPANGGLNSNFAGNPTQVSIFPAGPTPSWQGSITAKFSGTGSATMAEISNSVNSSVATGTLSYSNDYFFVLDTTPTTASSCTVTIANLAMQGNLGSANNCLGVARD